MDAYNSMDDGWWMDAYNSAPLSAMADDKRKIVIEN